jgi:small nuclear ribonucleoprotein (snRNP)-like protein
MKIRTINLFTKFSFLILSVFTFLIFSADSQKIQELINIIKSGPSYYRTPIAMANSSKSSFLEVVPSVSGEEALSAIKKSIRAAIKLAEFGEEAKAAIPVLIEVFPVAEDMMIISNAAFGPGMGKFEDWIQTYVVSSKNKFTLSSPFVEYATLSLCEKFIEASASWDIKQKKMSGQRIIEAIADIYVTLRINAAACALYSITGYSAGYTQTAWREWYSKNYGMGSGETTPQMQPQESAKTTYITTSANPPMDYIPGARYSIRLSTGDYIYGTVESVDMTSITFKHDNGARYIYEKSFIRERNILSMPYSSQQSSNIPMPAPSNKISSYGVSIPYEDLMNFTYSGKLMEITLKNGSVLRGTLGVVDATTLRITIDGTEVPIAKGTILKINLANTEQQPAGQQEKPQPW